MEFEDHARATSAEAAMFLRTVECIYDAAIDPERWQDAIDTLGAAFPDGHGTLAFHDLSDGHGSLAKTAGWDPDWVKAYNDYFNRKNPWLSQLRKRSVGTAVPVEFMMGRADLMKTEFFNDFLRPQGLVSGIGVTIAQDKDRFAAVGVVYPEAADEASEQNTRYLQRLAPHLQRAIQVNQRLEMSAIRSNAAEESLHKLRAGLLLVSPESKVLFSNRAADGMLGQGDGLSLTQNGQLVCASSRIGAQLRLAIRSAAMPPALEDRPPAGTIIVDRPSGRPAFALLVTPVRRAISGISAEQPAAAIFISNRDHGATPQLLSEALGITRAEGRVLSELLTGCTLPDCGARMDISPHTARTHLRHIFEKLGVSSKGQLMKHVAHHPIWLVDAQ
jgi:DNA-binding CsgD family transcriptional regulator